MSDQITIRLCEWRECDLGPDGGPLAFAPRRPREKPSSSNYQRYCSRVHSQAAWRDQNPTWADLLGMEDDDFAWHLARVLEHRGAALDLSAYGELAPLVVAPIASLEKVPEDALRQALRAVLEKRNPGVYGRATVRYGDPASGPLRHGATIEPEPDEDLSVEQIEALKEWASGEDSGISAALETALEKLRRSVVSSIHINGKLVARGPVTISYLE